MLRVGGEGVVCAAFIRAEARRAELAVVSPAVLRAAFLVAVARGASLGVVAPVVSLAAEVGRAASAELRVSAPIVAWAAGEFGVALAVLGVVEPAVAGAAVGFRRAFAVLVEAPVVAWAAEQLGVASAELVGAPVVALAAINGSVAGAEVAVVPGLACAANLFTLIRRAHAMGGVLLPGLAWAAVKRGIANAVQVSGPLVSLSEAALPRAIARAVCVVDPGVLCAAVLGGVALAQNVFVPGLVGAAVKLGVANAELVGPPAVVSAAFFVGVALVDASEENDLAKLNLIRFVVVEIELETLGRARLGHVVNLLPAARVDRVKLGDLDPDVSRGVPVAHSDDGGVAPRAVVGCSEAEAAVDQWGFVVNIYGSVVGPVLIPLVPRLSTCQKQVLREFSPSAAAVYAMGSSNSALNRQWVSDKVSAFALLVAVRKVGWALADFVVPPVVAVRSAAFLQTVARVAQGVVLPGLVRAAVFIGVARADEVFGPAIVGAASRLGDALAELVQRVDVAWAALLIAVALAVGRVVYPGVAKLHAAFRSRKAWAVLGVGQVGVALAAVDLAVARTVGVVAPVIALLRDAGVAEGGGVVNVRTALSKRVTGWAEVVLPPSLAWAASSQRVARADLVELEGVAWAASGQSIARTVQGVLLPGLTFAARSSRTTVAKQVGGPLVTGAALLIFIARAIRVVVPSVAFATFRTRVARGLATRVGQVGVAEDFAALQVPVARARKAWAAELSGVAGAVLVVREYVRVVPQITALDLGLAWAVAVLLVAVTRAAHGLRVAAVPHVDLALVKGVNVVRSGLKATHVLIESLLIEEGADVLLEASWVQLDGFRVLLAELVDDLLAVGAQDDVEGLLPHGTGLSQLKCSNLHESNRRGNQ